MAAATSSRRSGKGKTADERAAEVEALAKQLNEAVAALTSSEAWLRMLRVSARFSRYSANNVLLLWMQAEQRGVSLSRVAGYRAWQPEYGGWHRQVDGYAPFTVGPLPWPLPGRTTYPVVLARMVYRQANVNAAIVRGHKGGSRCQYPSIMCCDGENVRSGRQSGGVLLV